MHYKTLITDHCKIPGRECASCDHGHVIDVHIEQADTKIACHVCDYYYYSVYYDLYFFIHKYNIPESQNMFTDSIVITKPSASCIIELDNILRSI